MKRDMVSTRNNRSAGYLKQTSPEKPKGPIEGRFQLFLLANSVFIDSQLTLGSEKPCDGRGVFSK